ncbi:DUF4935 domain-containing protein [Desulfobulbus rhabdoformis]|uniref:PIN domain-containing protein n=1 Tax=Desulfobulbus rhabdoformis TaxID=34032 RepID=UPI00196673CD|nr:PIN domain-containing protein [Desulfobulbus rhabdoformis]MBM9616309.1 DUF4935 domain-containing protein [Desulfobulbus rhabdoformis]
MHIFIDTNIFFNNWYLRSAHFQIFSNYIKNTDARILLPKVICEEVENKYRTELKNVREEVQKAVRSANNFCFESFKIDIDQFPNDEYKFFEIANNVLNNVDLIGYENVDQRKIFSNALNAKKPFREKEKGYRDTLIWLSLLDYINNNIIEDEIVIITNNSKDFFESKNNEFYLHQDLIEDIKNYDIKNNFTVRNSLKAFIESNVKESLHSFQHDDIQEVEERFGEIFEEFLETHSRNYMNDLSLKEFSEIFEEAGYSTEILKLVKEYYFEIFEGLEDPEVISCNRIEEGRLYIEYLYNLRICTIQLRFSLADYYENQGQLEKEFFNPEFLDDEVILFAFPRCYYSSNFIFDIDNEAVEEFSIDSVFMKQ